MVKARKDPGRGWQDPQECWAGLGYLKSEPRGQLADWTCGVKEEK